MRKRVYKIIMLVFNEKILYDERKNIFMKTYDHKKIEKKWQTFWEKKKIFHASDFSKNEKPA